MNNWLIEDVGPWQEQQNFRYPQLSTPINQSQNIKTRQTTFKHTNTMTNLEFRQTRSRVKSMDTITGNNQRQVLKLAQVSQLCDFRISKELLMSRNSTLFPKQTIPRNFLQHSRKKTQANPRKVSLPMSPAIAIQIQKIEELVRQQTKAKKSLEVHKPHRFLNTLN